MKLKYLQNSKTEQHTFYNMENAIRAGDVVFNMATLNFTDVPHLSAWNIKDPENIIKIGEIEIGYELIGFNPHTLLHNGKVYIYNSWEKGMRIIIVDVSDPADMKITDTYDIPTPPDRKFASLICFDSLGRMIVSDFTFIYAVDSNKKLITLTDMRLASSLTGWQEIIAGKITSWKNYIITIDVSDDLFFYQVCPDGSLRYATKVKSFRGNLQFCGIEGIEGTDYLLITDFKSMNFFDLSDPKKIKKVKSIKTPTEGLCGKAIMINGQICTFGYKKNKLYFIEASISPDDNEANITLLEDGREAFKKGRYRAPHCIIHNNNHIMLAGYYCPEEGSPSMCNMLVYNISFDAGDRLDAEIKKPEKQGKQQAISNSGFYYSDAMKLKKKYEPDVEETREAILEELEQVKKPLSGLLIWFDPRNGGLQGWNADSDTGRPIDDEELFTLEQYHFDELVNDVTDGPVMDLCDLDEEEYLPVVKSCYAIICAVMMELHRDGKLKPFISSYPFSVFIDINDQGTGTLLTIVDEKGVCPKPEDIEKSFKNAIKNNGFVPYCEG